MKKLAVLFLFVFLALTLSACAAQTALGATLTQLPEEGSLLIFSVVSAVLAFLLNKLNLGEYTQVIAAVVSPILIALVEGWLGTVPYYWDDFIVSFIHTLVLFLAALGALRVATRYRYPKHLLES